MINHVTIDPFNNSGWFNPEDQFETADCKLYLYTKTVTIRLQINILFRWPQTSI